MNIIVKSTEEKQRAISDLLFVWQSEMYINEKGYLQKLIDLLFKMGYYEDNKSIFQGDK